MSTPPENQSEVVEGSTTRPLEIISTIKSLQVESERIKDVLDMEKACAQEVSSVMKHFLEQIGKSYNLEPAMFPRLGRGVNQIILTPQGIFFLEYGDGTKVARTFENLAPESLLKVLDYILPDVKQLLTERRQRLSDRAQMLEEVAAELSKIPNLPKAAKMATPPPRPE